MLIEKPLDMAVGHLYRQTGLYRKVFKATCINFVTGRRGDPNVVA